MEPKKTHREVKEAQITVQGLADYMAASERGKRSVVQDARYRATVRVVQYNEGKLVCANFMRKPARDVVVLRERGEQIREKLADGEFDASVNEHNADFVKRFADIFDGLALPTCEIDRGTDHQPLLVNKVRVLMRSSLVFRRTTRTNKVRTGALMFRYSKGRLLSADVGNYQSAAMFGFLKTAGQADGAEPERPLCLTLDVNTGTLFPAPGDAVDIWNDMKAACATIHERWPNIPPPPGAVL